MGKNKMCLTLLYFNFYFIFLLFVFSKLKCKIQQKNVVDNWQGMHIFRQDSGSYHLVFFFINHSLLRKTILWNILSQGKYITWYWRFFFLLTKNYFYFMNYNIKCPPSSFMTLLCHHKLTFRVLQSPRMNSTHGK